MKSPLQYAVHLGNGPNEVLARQNYSQSGKMYGGLQGKTEDFPPEIGGFLQPLSAIGCWYSVVGFGFHCRELQKNQEKLCTLNCHC